MKFFIFPPPIIEFLRSTSSTIAFSSSLKFSIDMMISKTIRCSFSFPLIDFEYQSTMTFFIQSRSMLSDASRLSLAKASVSFFCIAIDDFISSSSLSLQRSISSINFETTRSPSSSAFFIRRLLSSCAPSRLSLATAFSASISST